MWSLVIFLLVVVGLAAYCIAEYAPPAPQPIADVDQGAGLRHARAREEILTIEAVTRRLMRAVAVAPVVLYEPAVMASEQGAAVVRPVVDGFAWTASSLDSSSSGDRVTFYMPFDRGQWR
jgi:hypothetical protein